MKPIRTKVVGVTKQNPDGTSRQEIIDQELGDHTFLSLVPEPDNPHDSNAVAVYVKDTNLQIGFLQSDLARRMGKRLAKGQNLMAEVLEVTGGYGKKENLGVNIDIFDDDDEAPEDYRHDEFDDDLDELDRPARKLTESEIKTTIVISAIVFGVIFGLVWYLYSSVRGLFS